MKISEEAECKWIREHLHINHDDLIYADAVRWFEMMEHDFVKFLKYAVYGFSLKMVAKGHKKIRDDDITTFIREFMYKICLAVAGNVKVPGLPLFSIVGLELMTEEMLYETDAFRLQTGAEA